MSGGLDGVGSEPAGAATPAPRPPARRRTRLVAIAGGLLVVVGVVVFVLGRQSASDASARLGSARRHLATQQSSTRAAVGCERALRAKLPAEIAAGHSVLDSSATITVEDAALAAALRDEQAAGAQGRFDDYNAAVSRANAAAAAGNRVIDQVNQQLTTFQAANKATGVECT